MARLLPAVGTVSYNGFTFPPTFEAEVQAVPIRDTSGRYIKMTRYSITLRAIIFPDDAPLSTSSANVDINMDNIRCKLEKAGGPFVFVGQGLGRAFVVNTSSYIDPYTGATVGNVAKQDVVYGPFPTLISWKPVGSNRAVSIVWSVEVTVVTCCGQSGLNTLEPALGDFLEFNYSINWSINDSGATERTINGYYEIPGNRLSLDGLTPYTPSPTSNADAIWPVVFNSFPSLAGFRRRSNRNLAADKRRMNFSITDTEVESDNAFYPYMVNMDISHTVSGSFPKLAYVNNLLSGTVRIAPGVPRHWAFLAYSKVLAERLAISKKSFPYVSKGPNPAASQGRPQADSGVKRDNFTIITSYSFTENIYSREFSFAVTWQFIGGDAVGKAIEASGLFTPVQTDKPNWKAWSASMDRLVQRARGARNLRFGGSREDRMYFLCEDEPLITANTSVGELPQFIPEQVLRQAETPPPPDRSYLFYQMGAQDDYDRQQITHLPASNGESSSSKSGEMKSPTPNSTSGFDIDDLINEASKQEPIIQQLGPPLHEVTVTGRGIRVGYPVACPKVVKVGGVTAKVKSIRFKGGQIGSIFSGLPIYGGAWEIALALPSNPKGDTLTNMTTDGYPQQHV